MRKVDREFERVAVLIEEARRRAFHSVNEELIFLHFKIGYIVSNQLAVGAWGENTVGKLAEYIQNKIPRAGGFTRRGLYRMKQFYENYSPESDCFQLWRKTAEAETQMQQPVEEVISIVSNRTQFTDKQYDKFVSTVLTQIQWSSHLHILSKTKTGEERLFYLVLAITERLSVRELERQLNTAVFERTMLLNPIVSTALTQLPESIFKDPYIFEFLHLAENHSEKDLEQALVANLQKFILEIGKGFTYMGNQYRLQVGNKEYYPDLLFYHRDLQCMVLFELKIQEFEPEFLGKLNFYLEALDRDIKRPFENSSIGVLLCKGKDTEVVEYAMARNISPTVIADYETKLIDKKVLAGKLLQLSELASKIMEE